MAYSAVMRRQKKVDPIASVSKTGGKHHERRKDLASKVTFQAVATRPAKGDHRANRFRSPGKLTPVESEAKFLYERMEELLHTRQVSEQALEQGGDAKARGQEAVMFHRESVVLDSSKANLHPSLRRAPKKKKKDVDQRIRTNFRKEEEKLMQELSMYHQRDYLAKSTHFTYEEIGHLQVQFNKITELHGTPGEMKRLLFNQMFVDVFGVTDQIMVDNIFRYFDADGEGSVSCSEWIQNLSTILRGSLTEQVQYVYKIYDLNGDGGIGREEIRIIIADSLNTKHHFTDEDDDGDEDPTEQLYDIVEMVMRKLEDPISQQITLQSFYEAVKRDPINLQCLGQCLPDPRKAKAFLALLTNDPHSFTQNYSLPGKASYPDEAAKYDRRRSNLPNTAHSVMNQMFSHGATRTRLSADGRVVQGAASTKTLAKRDNFRLSASMADMPKQSTVFQPRDTRFYH